MDYAPLGKSALRVSRIGFGCMSLTDNEADNTRLLNRAVDLGINYFDTADMYAMGMNESIIGNILHGRRKELILATKVGNQWRSDGSGWDWNPRKDYIIDSVEKSLQRLRTDYIDLYQLHGGTNEDPIDETIEAFELLQQQGKIRYYGLSSIRPSVIREYVNRSGMVSVMMQYGLLDRRPEESCLPLLLGRGIGVLARGSLAKGQLVDKQASGWLDYSKEEIGTAARVTRSFSETGKATRPGGIPRSPAQTALRFVLQHPAVTVAVTGIRTPAQLEEAAATTGSPALTLSEMQSLREAIPANYYKEHR